MSWAEFEREGNQFSYPWESEGFIERLRKLSDHRKGKKTIAYIYRAADNSTFRYRIYNMCERLNKTGEFSATYFFVNELAVVEKYIESIDEVVIVRVPWSIELDKFISRSYAKNIKLYFDIDDLICDIAHLPFVMNALDVEMAEETYKELFQYASRLFLTGSMCDACITTNDYLADKLNVLFGKKTFVIKNFINDAQAKISDGLWRTKKMGNLGKTSYEKKIIMGYFSGSPSHNNDLRSIAEDLFFLMKGNKNVHLRLVGYIELPWVLHDFAKEGRVEYFPMQNYVALQTRIAECDINLIPLLVSNFTHCKSEIKYFEAAIVGAISIASPTYIYKKIIKDEENGFLAQQGQWQEKINRIIEGSYDRSMTETARSHAMEQYYGESITVSIKKLFSGDNFGKKTA